MVEHAPGNQRPFDAAVIGDTQQGTDLRDAAEFIGAHRHDLHVGNRHFAAHAVDFIGAEPPGRIARSADEILRCDVVEFTAPASGVEIALVGHLIIHHWHASHYRAPRVTFKPFSFLP